MTGVADAKKLLEDIPNKISNFLGIIADVNLYTESGKDYIEIVVPPNSYPVSYKGEYHYRTGSTKQQFTGAALNQFLLKKTGITWDGVPVEHVTVDDFRNDSFDIFKEQAVRSRRMNKQDINLNKEELLNNLNLMENGVINRAGILLFHHNPERWVFGSYIKIGYFETDADLRYQDEIHGSLISQADRVVDLLFTKYLKADISYEGVTRVETYPYPKEALREAIYNAIVHKNYATLIPIQVSVYNDRIYIGNECVFPEDWTVDNLLGKHNSRPYNPLIANTFFRAGYIESWGRGIQKIRESCEENGNEMAEYKVSSSEVMVVFHGLQITANLHDGYESTQDERNNTQDNTQDNTLTDKARKILTICKEPKSKQEIVEFLGYKTIKSIKTEMEELLKTGRLNMTIPHKPNSRNQKYITVKDKERI